MKTVKRIGKFRARFDGRQCAYLCASRSVACDGGGAADPGGAMMPGDPSDDNAGGQQASGNGGGDNDGDSGSNGTLAAVLCGILLPVACIAAVVTVFKER